MKKPEKIEYNEFYYTYIRLVEDKDILGFLDEQRLKFVSLIESLEEEKGGIRYSEGKWSIKEVIAHILDTERVMAYRALAISRGDQVDLPGFDQNEYMDGLDFSRTSFKALADDFTKLRESNLSLFQSFTDDQLAKVGSASGFPVSTKALIYIIVGHLEHHNNILLNRYLT